jgi:parvulin-like peptidyl-prolyl isomerase
MVTRVVLALALVLGLFVNGARAEEDAVLGKAGDYVVKQSDLDRMIRNNPPDRQRMLQENPDQRVAVVRFMLEVKVISDRARKEQFDKKSEVKEQLEFMADNYLAQEYLVTVIIKEFNPTDEEMKEFYSANAKSFAVPEQVRVRHILLRLSPGAPPEEKGKVKEKAETLLKRIRDGENFVTLATEYSEDPGSKNTGGDLGYFTRGQVVKSFEEAAFSLKPGQTSEVVETQFGYHLIKMEDYKEAGTRPFDEVKNSIRSRLQEERKKSDGEEFIKQVTREGAIEVYPDRITGKKSD